MDDVEDIYELSPMQEGMLFHALYDRESALYSEQIACTLLGDLDEPAFHTAWQRIVDRQPALRSSFHWADLEKPMQVVHRSVSLPWERRDWSHDDRASQEAQYEALLSADRRCGFDLEEPPLLRCALIRLDQETHRFVWSHHHLLCDGWSMSVVLSEVWALYRAARRDPGESEPELPPARPYRDYIGWLHAQDRSAAEAFWREELAGVTAPTMLPIDLREPRGAASGERAVQPGSFSEQSLALPEAATGALRSFVRSNGLTLATLVQGAWALLLARYTDSEDVLFGMTVSGRPPRLPGVTSTVGLFVNTLPARIRVPSGVTAVVPWLQEIQSRQAQREQYGYTSLVDMHGWSALPAAVPLFENILVVENYPVGEAFSETQDGLQITEVQAVERTNYPLTLGVTPGAALSLQVGYDAERFDDAAVRRMLGHLSTLLEGIARNPDQDLWQVPLLTDAERHQVLEAWNATDVAYPIERCVHEVVEQRAVIDPDAIAVETPVGRLTYGELDRRANRLAQHLCRLGVGRGSTVGIMMERSPGLYAGLLGILKSGAAFVPLDPLYPPDRIAYIAGDARLAFLMLQESIAGAAADIGVPLLIVDGDGLPDGRAMSATQDVRSPAGEVTPEDWAYIIYTSGSTGQPKGVPIRHRSLVNYMFAAADLFDLRPQDRVLQFASVSFDTAMEEIFPTWAAGGTVVARNDVMLASPRDFLQACGRLGITVLDLPTAYWHQLVPDLAAGRSALPSSLRLTIIGGEKALPQHMAMWRDMISKDARLLNGYGPTEITIVATFWELPGTEDAMRAGSAPRSGTGERVSTIGRPIANVRAYILDHVMNPAPVGVPGELYVGGAGLSEGYINQPELTRARFVANPFAEEPGSRLYRTGDRARYLPDGNIEYLGRVDGQVKLRGFRIELGEIETVLAEHPGVGQAAVVLSDVPAGEKALVGYVVARAAPAPTVAELRRHLQQRLPEYMVPAAWSFLEALPLNVHGKVDRLRLPAVAVDNIETGAAYTAPQDELEQTIASIFGTVLRREKVGVHDDFFQMGGHSLLAIQVAARIYESCRVEIPLRVLLQTPTVARIAEAVRTLLKGETRARLPTVPAALAAPVAAGAADLPSVVVPIRVEGHGSPLFCIHPGGGIVFPYYGLAPHLDATWPLFGIQDPSYNGGGEPFERIEDMATHYVTAIRQVTPRGPYHLVGWSFGGLVAYQMAVQLSASGQEVGLVGMLDTPAPPSAAARGNGLVARARDSLGKAATYGVLAVNSVPHIVNALYLMAASAFRRRAVKQTELRLGEKLRWLWLRSSQAYLLRRAGMAAYVRPDSDLMLIELPSLRRVLALLAHHNALARRYMAPAFAGRLTLFNSEETLRQHAREPALGWQALAAGGVDIRPVPSNHAAMLSEPYVKDVARALGQALGAFQRQ